LKKERLIFPDPCIGKITFESIQALRLFIVKGNIYAKFSLCFYPRQVVMEEERRPGWGGGRRGQVGTEGEKVRRSQMKR
jgi:hypothetical protein